MFATKQYTWQFTRQFIEWLRIHKPNAYKLFSRINMTDCLLTQTGSGTRVLLEFPALTNGIKYETDDFKDFDRRIDTDRPCMVLDYHPADPALINRHPLQFEDLLPGKQFFVNMYRLTSGLLDLKVHTALHLDKILGYTQTPTLGPWPHQSVTVIDTVAFAVIVKVDRDIVPEYRLALDRDMLRYSDLAWTETNE